MGLLAISLSRQQKIGPQATRQAQGFALVSLLALAPLFAAVLTCLGAAFYTVKRKSLAQSICVQQASRLQNELAKPLSKLIALNPHAERLRAQRTAADRAWEKALASGFPPAMAGAKAIRLAVIAQQIVLRARQLALLSEAQSLRNDGERELRRQAQRLRATNIQSRAYYHRALAVEPKPRSTLTPNYETVPLFESLQQHRFRYTVNLLENFPALDFAVNARQTTECAVSLTGKDKQWNIKILAAKAV